MKNQNYGWKEDRYMLKLDNRNKLIVTPEILAVRSFKSIWDKDKSKDKAKAMRVFSYIYFKYNPKSPYLKKATGEGLDLELKRDIIGDVKWKATADVTEAETIYSSVMISSGMKALQSAQKFLELITAQLDTGIDLTAIADETKRIAVMKSALGLINDMPDATRNLALAMKKLKAEQLEKIKDKNKDGGTMFELPRSQR